MDLNNKVAIVTGGSRGIGRAIALELGRAGAKVVVNYNRNADAAQAVATEIGGIAVQADVSSADDCNRLMEAATALGSLDVLVNNAGITRDGLMVRMSDEDWADVLNTNLNSAFRMCRAATEIMMRQRSGSIINVTSVSGIRGNAGQANYSASKAAVAAMSASLAKEMGRRGIRVNCVAPGTISGLRMRSVMEREAAAMNTTTDVVKAAYEDQVSMRTFVDASDIAATVAFLCSDAARFINGEIISVDGHCETLRTEFPDDVRVSGVDF